MGGYLAGAPNSQCYGYIPHLNVETTTEHLGGFCVI